MKTQLAQIHELVSDDSVKSQMMQHENSHPVKIDCMASFHL